MKRIESLSNSLVKYWKKLATTRKERDQSGEFLVEGFHLVEEALQGTDVLNLIVREGVEIPATWNIDNIYMVEVTAAIAAELAETERTQGIFAHCKQPDFEVKSSWKKFLLIDAVQDPGNVGTMIRTADAAGMDAVILGKGSADPFNPKTIRSTQGSIFHLPVLRGELVDWVEQLQERDIPIYGTALDATSVVYNQVQKTPSFAVIMGNEGSGISKELLTKTTKNVIIPIMGGAESLNVAVATGIVLYHFATAE
ncbi:RNA methyltransferase [Kurthia gibsonii]|uniref:TrmH family RNA methyltransferase n=1 Tax=Kurthia TaxID=1649 RepID=UPI000745D73E|nr:MULTISPECIES: RNA methyltransferase [Kurthia]AMA62409.1 RNA 2'-O ribose methyltransferase substrate binding family protein [Kurthia sp. 11kri321]MEB6112626.1 RNA methyltransferase [Kurthia gibsonii]WIL37749.1 RNA methyltransferase [Kurthia sp. YJT4]HZG12985.1 RNA methyltransferase [Kurthia gibsonii]